MKLFHIILLATIAVMAVPVLLPCVFVFYGLFSLITPWWSWPLILATSVFVAIMRIREEDQRNSQPVNRKAKAKPDLSFLKENEQNRLNVSSREITYRDNCSVLERCADGVYRERR